MINGARIRKLVRHEATAFETERRGDTTNTNYGEPLPYSSIGTRELFITGTSEDEQPTAAGEQQSGMLAAVALPDTDIEVNDRITVAGSQYEVTDLVGIPDDENAEVLRFSLEDV